MYGLKVRTSAVGHPCIDFGMWRTKQSIKQPPRCRPLLVREDAAQVSVCGGVCGWIEGTLPRAGCFCGLHV